MALQQLVRRYDGFVPRANRYRDGGGRGLGTQWVEPEEGVTLEGRMEEDTELEEGETVEGGQLDLDSRFDYLDTRIQEVLGDCQKEFQGSLFTDKLGSKVGIYGSFLPTHVRGAPVLHGPPQAPPGVPPRSRLLEGQMERGRRIVGNGLPAAADRAAKASPNGSGKKSQSQMEKSVLSAEGQINGVNHTVDAFVVGPVKGNKRQDGGPVDQKKLTVRLNLGKKANKVGKKTIYNGFGLDNSSSPSTDEDPDDALSASEDESSPDRSPGEMIRIMTSFVVPRGGLLSPLSEKLPEPLDRKQKPLSIAKGIKKQLTGSSAGKPDAGLGPGATRQEIDVGKDSKVAKEKIEKVKGKPLDRREASQVVDSGKPVKKETENDGRTGKEGRGSGPKVSQKLENKGGMIELETKAQRIERDVDVRDIVAKDSETAKEPIRSTRKEKVFSMNLVKEDGSEFPTTDMKETRKAKEDSIKDVKKLRETSVERNLKEMVAKESLKEKRKGGNKDSMKAKREEEALQKDFEKLQSRKAFGKQGDAVVAEREILKDGLVEVKPKGKESSKGLHFQKESKDKARDALKDGRKELKKESSKIEASRDLDESGKEDPKESSKAGVREVSREFWKDSMKWDYTDQGMKDAKSGKKPGKKPGKKGGKEPKAANKDSDRESGPAGDFLGLVRAEIGAPHPVPEALQMPSLPAVPGVEAPAGAILPAGQLVLDHWVQCDKCQQWRLLVPMIDPEDLPEKWLCKMMTWLPGLNNCKFSEDVTTAAVYKLLGLQNPTLQNPQLNPGLQAQQHPLAPALFPASGMTGNKSLQSKPGKVQKSGSKKGMGKKAFAGVQKISTANAKRMETSTVKSRSLNDVGQLSADQVADRTSLGTNVAEGGGYAQVAGDNPRKLKHKEKLTRTWANEGDDFHPQKLTSREEDRNRVTGSWPGSQELGKAVKVSVTVDGDNNAEGNAWIDSLELEPGKQQKRKYLQDGSRTDTAGLKRKKKADSEEHAEQLRPVTKSKADEIDGLLDSRKRPNGDEFESGLQPEKRRIVTKPDSKDWGSSREAMRDEKKGQMKRVGSRTEIHKRSSVEEQSHEVDSPRNERVDDVRGKNVSSFDEVSGIARTYAAPQSLEERAGDSPNTESPHRDMGTYRGHAGQSRGASKLRTPPSSSSKVSYSGQSSALGSKGGSPIESTVSSSPVGSFKVDEEATEPGVTEGLPNNHPPSYSHPSDKLNSMSPSPKRSLDEDEDEDAHSDREGAIRGQSHRNWDDWVQSSDHEPEFRGGSGHDPGREAASGRDRDGRYATSNNSREGAEFRKFDRTSTDERFWEETRETRAGSAGFVAAERGGYERHRDEHYREREDSVDRYRDRDIRYDRRNSREERSRERDRERDRERARSRENWPADRGGDVREERYSRERSVRQDRAGGGPPSREGRPDKHGNSTWQDDSRLVRDVGREGRDRLDDDNADNKHDIRANHVEVLKDDHPRRDGHEASNLQKDDPGHRYENVELGPPKDAKSNFGRAPPPGQASHNWEGDKVGPYIGRKDADAGAPRNGLEAHVTANHVNSRSRVDIPQSGLGSIGVRAKPGQVDGSILDFRIVELKQSKEHKKGPDEDALLRVGAAKALGPGAHSTRGIDLTASSLSYKEHAALAMSLTEEARNLKHSADRLKSALMEVESRNVYMEASLKFLLSAHHSEMASTADGSRQAYASQAIQMYNETAKFFDFCAGTYERQKDLAEAALAHICSAVARFRGLMGNAATLNKDCMALQSTASFTTVSGSQIAGVLTPPTGLPPPPPLALSRVSEKPRVSHGLGAATAIGESPSSSSASDVDNLNNHALTGEKGLSANALKGATPSPMPGSGSGSTELVPQRLQSSLHRTIRNGMDVFAMMESWTKAQNATAAAETAFAGVPRRQEGMLAVRRVVEMGMLGNMEAVVRQVRLALDAIGH